MGGDVNVNQGNPQTPAQSPEKKETTPTARVYTEAELQARLTQAGRDAKALETWESNLKVKEAGLKTIEQERQQIADEREQIAKQLEDLAQKDPDRHKLVQRERELKDLDRRLKDDRRKLDEEIEANKERIKRTEIWERDQHIHDVVADYEGVSEDKLKTLCTKLNLTTLEQIKAAAETIGTKKAPPKDDTPASRPADSAETLGGGDDWKAIRDAFIKTPNDPEVRRRYLEARRKRGL